MPNNVQLAARGDLAAYRALISETLAYGRGGISLWSDAVRDALCYARLAAAHSNAPEDVRNLLDMLNLVVEDADKRGDERTKALYTAEMIAEADDMADAGDESAGQWLAAVMAKVEPKIAELSILLKKAREEYAASVCLPPIVTAEAEGPSFSNRR